MKKRWLAFLTVLFAVCLGAMFAACTPGESGGEKQVTEVAVQTLPDKTEYALNEPFSVSGGKIVVHYSDGSSVSLDMTEEMYESAPTSEYGEHTLRLTFTHEGEQYSVTFDYTVIFSETSNAFVKAAEALPALNKVTTTDAQAIKDVLAQYESLGEEDKQFLSDTYADLLNRVRLLQDRILDDYAQEAKSAAAEYLELLNTGNYTEENLALIQGYIDSFSNMQDFVSLAAVDEAETKLYADIDAVEKRTDDPSFTVEDYKESTISALKAKLRGTMYAVTDTESGISIAEVPVDYAEEEAYSARVEALLAPVEDAGTAEAVDAAYAEAAGGVRDLYLEAFTERAADSLNALMTDLRATLQEEIDRWYAYADANNEAVDETGEGTYINREQVPMPVGGDPSIAVGLDYLNDSTPNRWWIPEPLRLSTIVGAIDETLAAASTTSQLNEAYASFADEIVRATLQRNFEVYYAIQRTLNPQYDMDSALYWNNISVYWGDDAGSGKGLTYNGVLSDYAGMRYGNGGEGDFRLCHTFYEADHADYKTTFDALIADYNEKLAVLTPAPLQVKSVSIETPPTKLTYEVGETFTVAGGTIRISYNWSAEDEVIPMTDEMYEASDVDTSVGGSKTVVLSFKVKTGETQTVTLEYTVIANVELSALLDKINALPAASEATADDIEAVKECIAMVAELDEDQKAEFEGTYSAIAQKLADVQAALVPVYVADRIQAVQIAYETINYYNYTEENRTLLDEKFAALNTGLASAVTFADADALFATYESELGGIPVIGDGEGLDTYKTNSKNSAARLAEIRLYQVSGDSPAAVAIGYQTVSLAQDPAVAAALAALNKAIDEAADADAVGAAYQANIGAVYAAVLDAYKAAALANIKALVADLRATAKSVWEKDYPLGTETFVCVSANSVNISLDYMTNIDSYQWWTPEPFMVSTLYNKLTVNGSSLSSIGSSYEAAYVEMLRAVMYRNLFTVWHYNADKSSDIANKQWSTLHSYHGSVSTLVYDGTIAEYQGVPVPCATTDFRLWHWGFKPDEKITTVAGLLEKYNFDMAAFLIAE